MSDWNNEGCAACADSERRFANTYSRLNDENYLLAKERDLFADMLRKEHKPHGEICDICALLIRTKDAVR